MSAPNGEFGGVVVRRLSTAGLTLNPGDEISAEDACSWPIANRQALSNSGMVRWHSERQSAPVDLPKPVVDVVDEPVSDETAEVSEPAKRGRPPKAKE